MAKKDKEKADHLAAIQEVVAKGNAHPSNCGCETCKGLATLKDAEEWWRTGGEGQAKPK